MAIRWTMGIITRVSLFSIINYLDIELIGSLQIISSGATVSLATTRMFKKIPSNVYPLILYGQAKR